MRAPLLLVMACAGAGFALAAGAELPPELADLQRRIAAAPAAQRAALLTGLADRFEPVDPLRGIPLAREAMASAAAEREKLAAQAVLASLLRYETDYTAAKELAQAGLARATALGDDRLRARFAYELGRITWNLADHAEALKRFHEAIRLGEQLGDARLLAGAHLFAFIVWLEFDDQEHALAHLESERKYAEQVGDAWRLADYYRALGNYRLSTHDLAAARAAHQRSRDISAAAGQTRGFADSSINLSAVAESDGQLDTARAFAEEAAGLYARLGLKRYLCNAHRQLGRVLVKQKKFPEALDALNRSLALAEGFGGRAAIANTWRQLAIAHEAAGNPTAAADYRAKLDAETAAIFGERSREKILLLDAQSRFERGQQQIELLRRDEAFKDAELQHARLERYALMAMVILGVLTTAAIVSRQRMKFAVERRVHEQTRAAQQAAEEASRLKTRLLGIASHDLRSPLAAIIGCATEIQRRPHDAAHAAEFSEMMRQEAERMLGLVGDFLDVSMIESKGLKLTCRPCDLGVIVRERMALHRAAATAKEQTIECTMATNQPAIVCADAARLAQVFDNLISNAIKFTPRARTIAVSVEAGSGGAIARVRDSGPGLRPEDFARLFQPFEILSARPTGDESSSGLGLFIAREIVALHGGRLGVDSVPGEGATFSVELPLCPEAANPKADDRKQSNPPNEA